MAVYNGWMGDYAVPNVAPALSDLTGAAQDYRQRRDDREIGEAAASGKLSDAASVAFKKGNLKTGLALKEMDQDSQEKVRKLIGQAALNADTPEKWSALQKAVSTRFPGEELEPFEEREGIVSMYRDYYKDRDDARADRAASRDERRLQIAEAQDRRAAALGGKAPVGYRYTDTGDLEAIPGGPADKAGERPKLNVIDKKEIFEAEDRKTALSHTIENLRAAKEISSKAFEGAGAGAWATLGAKIPGGGLLADRAKAEATLEYEKIMTPEALANMAATLKGATTDQEMNKYIDLISDPSTPIEIRNRIIDRMISLAERQASLDEQRINEIRGDTYYDPGGGLSGGGKKSDAKKDDPLGLR